MTMSPVFMVFALIAASLCHSGDCSDKCSKPLPDNQMLSRNECLAGYYKKVSCQNSSLLLCEKCEKGTYIDRNNTLLDCFHCSVCKSDEIATSECTNKKNRECGCKDGLYQNRETSFCESCTKCRNCSLCPGCKGNCGVEPCKHGQFLDQKGKCQSCANGDCSDKCSKPLPDNQMLSRNECLAGYYKKGSCKNSNLLLCEKCEKGTYTDHNNTLLDCFHCSVCKSDEIATSECTNKKNRECGCKDGLYQNRETSFCESCTKCRNCSLCPGCKGNCGVEPCKHGQFLDQKGKCQSCADHSCSDKSCKSFCRRVPDPTITWILVLGITVGIVVLLGLFAVCRFIWKAYRRRQPCCWALTKNTNERPASHNEVPPNMPTLPDQPGEQLNILLPSNINPGSAAKEPGTRDKERHLDLDWNGQITAPLIINGDIKGLTRHESEKEMWPAPVLYTIIKQVPVRRWKEFLRLLSLSDDQMERVELEARGSYLELQYQMLRLWSQMSGACLENIYSTLQYMDLSGCAEDLQEKLQQLQETLV